MVTRLEPVSPAHFPALYEALLGPLNNRIPVPVWRRLVDQPWRRDEESMGQLLIDGERLVGFAGYVHARLPRPDGSDEPLLNVTTWVVEPAYGNQALSLIMPALQRRDVTITNMTPLRSVHEMFARLGFSELESRTCVLRPAPFSRSPWGRAETVTRFEDILTELPPWERRVAESHRTLARHVLVRESGGEHCYAMYTLGRRRRLRSARVHWVTPGTLASASLALRRAIARDSGALLTEMDARLAPAELPGMMFIALPVPRLFRSSALSAEEVPSAFSELVLLDL